MTNFYEDYKNIVANPNLTKSQKVELLQKAKENYDREADAARDKEIANYRLGAALEIGSAAIPIGGAGRLGAQVGLDVLKSGLGKKIAQEIGSGIGGGLASGAVFGAGRGMLENKNPIVTTAQDAAAGAVLGGALGAGGAYLQKGIRDAQLKNYNLDNSSSKAFRKTAEENYRDYIQGRSINHKDLGQIEFTRKGMDETLSKNPELAKQFPDLPKALQKADYKETNPLYKVRQDKATEKFHTLKSGDVKHYVAEDKLGNKKFYLSRKDAAGQGTPPSLGGTSSNSIPTTSIPHGIREFNPPFSQHDIGNMTKEEFMHYEPVIMDEMSHGKIIMDEHGWSQNVEPMNLSGNIFTREQIGKMSGDEYRKNEAAIMKQWKEKGIPTNQELEKARSKQQSKSNKTSDKGHWVTINGKHIFMED